MRFTSAVISSFLAAAVVLADPQPLAGTRFITQEAFNVTGVTFKVPPVFCGQGIQVLNVGLSLDDPSTCPGAIEVGVAIKCDHMPNATYRAYSRWYPRDLVYHDLMIHEGSEIRVGLAVLWEGISMLVNNGTHNATEDLGSQGVHQCQNNVVTFVRSDQQPDGSLVEIPEFDRVIFYDVGAWDTMGKWFGPEANTDTLDMIDGNGVTWAVADTVDLKDSTPPHIKHDKIFVYYMPH